MIHLNSAVIVEGKYDKIRLENIIDALIITTNGFEVFHNEEKRQLIKLLANERGIIIITDSDSAGRLIRNHLQSFITSDKIKNVYLPQIKGKEKRKAHSSAEGFLGVEGTDDEIIRDALNKFGITAEETNQKRKSVTKTDLYMWGLSGTDNSEQKRKGVLKFLNFPEMSANAFLDLINALYGYDKFLEVLKKWQQEQTKK